VVTYWWSSHDRCAAYSGCQAGPLTRIIAGSAGGRRITVPQQRSGRGTRPTTDRVRESLFNVLENRLDFGGLTVLDLFAGSGALGLEALSRGAASALFVESDHRAAAVISRNAADIGLTGAVVRRGAVATVLAAGAPTPVELVFADPPYAVTAEDIDQMIRLLVENGWCTTDTVIVVERPTAAAEIGWPAGFSVWPTRRYGDTRLEMACYGQHP